MYKIKNIIVSRIFFEIAHIANIMIKFMKVTVCAT